MDLDTFIRFLNWFLMLSLPVLLGIFLADKFHFGWRTWLIGASTFIISQVFHLPFNFIILNPKLEIILNTLPDFSAFVIIALALGLSAGIFEECSRYGMYRWWLKDNRSWRMGLMAGAGHGGIESIILGVLVMLSFFNLMAYRYTDLSSLKIPPEQLIIAQQQIQVYWSLPWYDSLIGALERLFTIPFHIASSILVLQVFTRKPERQAFGWLLLAVLYHAVIDASVVFIHHEWGSYWAEAFLGFMVVLDLVIIFSLRQPEPIVSLPLPTQFVPVVITPPPVEETSENLENTRYQ